MGPTLLHKMGLGGLIGSFGSSKNEARDKVMSGKSVLLVIGGGIAAYKSLELIRLLRQCEIGVRCVLTAAAQQFVTPLSAASLSGGKAYTDLFSLTDEAEMGHIELSRSADLVIVAPATADLMAKMAHGIANDLASTLLLATDKKILVAPAMNLRMWLHPATKRNAQALRLDGVSFAGPGEGEMACGEYGPGRMAEPAAILSAAVELLKGDTALSLPADGQMQAESQGLLSGRHVVVTSGPTHEAIDPVRYLANRSSGKQGHAIAAAAANAGARVTLISGPVAIPAPAGVESIQIETAAQMLAAAENSLPADVFIAAAAVADWRVDKVAPDKVKKGKTGVPMLRLVENPDILKTIAGRKKMRPKLVVGFAAETSSVLANAREKLARKGCDIIVANDVSPASGVMGGDVNTVHIISRDGVENWPQMHKTDVARRLIDLLGGKLKGRSQ